MLARVRLAGVTLAVVVGLLGALFFGLVQSQNLKRIVDATLGPESDLLSGVAFHKPTPDIWRLIAINHGVTILVEPADGEPVVFDPEGEQLPSLPTFGRLRSVRTGPDGTRVTLSWPLWSFRESHAPLLAGLLFLVTAVVGSAFWFLHRQLKPLSQLHGGVEAVGRGDFDARVPVVRQDEIGQVASAFNAMARRVGGMIADRERLLADVSHELRSPISRMKVALEFMPEGDKRDSLDRDLRTMGRLVTVLLEREALRARAGRLEAEDVDLHAIVLGVAESFADREPGVEVSRAEVRGADETRLQADPTLLELLVQNLVDNAVKFSREDSDPVAVSLTEDRDGDGRRQVVLRVADDGVGVPEGDLDALFEPFLKLDRARSHGMGYGVGLNLCQRIVHLHGGTIEISRREPRGTEVVVKLPVD